MSSNKLEALKAAFDKKTAGTGTGDQTWKLKYPFWKIAEDTVATVRFLPDSDADNPLGFLVENLTHELIINGKRETVACATMHGESCPICNLSRQFYDDEGDGSSNGKKYYRKKSYLGQVIVVDSPIEHNQDQLVKLIEFGPQVYKQIQAAFQSGDLDDVPYEMKGGYNFRFRKTKTGQGQNSYTTSNFAPKQTDLEDSLIEKIELYSLKDYRAPRVSLEAMEAMLIAEQTGGSVDSHQNDAAPVAKEKVEKDEEVSTISAPAKTKTVEAPETGNKTTSVIEQLKARAAAKAAASAE